MVNNWKIRGEMITSLNKPKKALPASSARERLGKLFNLIPKTLQTHLKSWQKKTNKIDAMV